MLRGMKEWQDNFIRDLQSQKYPFPVTKDGKTFTLQMAGQLRPIRLFEYIFPEDHKDIVLTSLEFHKIPYPETLKMRMMRETIRKALGHQKIPEFKKDKSLFFVKGYNPDENHIGIIPIGVKYDEKRFIDGDQSFHEAI